MWRAIYKALEHGTAHQKEAYLRISTTGTVADPDTPIEVAVQRMTDKGIRSCL
jgi:hypothetical protein